MQDFVSTFVPVYDIAVSEDEAEAEAEGANSEAVTTVVEDEAVAEDNADDTDEDVVEVAQQAAEPTPEEFAAKQKIIGLGIGDVVIP